MTHSNYLTKRMRIAQKAGRTFTDRDSPSTPRVAVINESSARALFLGESPVGKYIKLGDRDSDNPWMVIVVVVGNVHQDGLDQSPALQVYTALSQQVLIGYYRLVARTTGDPMRMQKAVRSVFSDLDQMSPVYHVKPQEDYFSGRLSARTFTLASLGVLGGLAMFLAVIGTYVTSYSANGRTREMAIRMALGAPRWNVLATVLRNAAIMLAWGVGIGCLLSLWLTQVLSSLLYEIHPIDLPTFAWVGIAVFGAALLAAYIPARRATLIQPAQALRLE